MKMIFFILLTLLTSSGYADEVFKCQLKSGKTVYQSLPCESHLKQEVIEIQEPDPRKVAEEEAKLKEWKEDFAKREAERTKAEKELQAEQDRKASVEALQKSAEYQRQQAYEAKRQAEALERQYRQSQYPQYQFFPYYPAFQQIPASPSFAPHQHDFKKKDFADSQQPRRNEIPPDKHTDDDSDSKNSLLQGYRRH